MKKDVIHNTNNDFSDLSSKMISESHIRWDRSKKDIWLELEGKMEAGTKGRTISLRSYSPLRMAVAAGLTILIAASAFISFYSKTIVVPAGRHYEISLPDNSIAKLNAESELSYRPLIWSFSRKVKFNGEAFFEVEKGRSFEVISDKGKTTVLGTSFNIYSRNDAYHVTCISGKVMVEGDREEAAVTILPGQRAVLNSEGSLSVLTGVDTSMAVSWIQNRLTFTSSPLKDVFEEISRQYNIELEIETNIDNIYTGTFYIESSAQNVLNLVCRPFDLTVIPKSDNEYIITRN